MRIETDEFHFAPQVVSNAAQNAFKYLRIVEKSRTVVKTEPVLREIGSSSAQERQAFEHSNANARPG